MTIEVRSRATETGDAPLGSLRGETDVAMLRNPALSLGMVMAVTGYLRSFLWTDAAVAAPAAAGRAPAAAPGTAERQPQAPVADEAPKAFAPIGLEDTPARAGGTGGGGSAPPGSHDAPQPALAPVLAPANAPGPGLPDPGLAPPAAAAPATPPPSAGPASGATLPAMPAEAAAITEPTPQPGAVARFLGTTGDDRLTATERADEIIGLAGNDLIHALGGDDSIDAGAGDDRVAAGAGADIVLAGSGDDIVLAGAGDDRVEAGAGNDRVWGEDGADLLLGGAGDDMLDGGAGDDLLDGGAGDDTLQGGAGADAIAGGTGRDLIFAGLGDDLVTGDEDADTLFGEAGDDILIGGTGDDWLDGGTGTDEVDGGAGDDWIVAAADGVEDVYLGGQGHDTLDYAEAMEALSIDLVAGTVDSAATGRDSLAGIERLIAGSGDDLILFGAEPATVTGGAGDDCFDFSALEPGAPQPDLSLYTITDFEVGDRLRLGGDDFRSFRDDKRNTAPETAPETAAETEDAVPLSETRTFGRFAEEHFDSGGVRLSFVNRVEANRFETLVRLDLDRDGTWDHAIEIAHAKPWAGFEEDLATA